MIEKILQWGRDHRPLLDKITSGLIWATIIIWIIWDVYVALVGAKTESRIIADWSSVSVALPWAIGMLCGHWFALWRKKPAPHSTLRTSINFGFFGLLLVWDFCTYKFAWTALASLRYPGYWPIIGFPMGRYLWGQRMKTSVPTQPPSA
jgi:hypothetical protein